MNTNRTPADWLFEADPAIDIKAEPAMDSPVFSLLSPPSSPSVSRSVPTSRLAYQPPDLVSPRRYSISGLASPKRSKPYSIPPRDSKSRADIPGRMSYPGWPSHGLKTSNAKSHTGERRSMDLDQSSALADAIMNTVSLHHFLIVMILTITYRTLLQNLQLVVCQYTGLNLLCLRLA